MKETPVIRLFLTHLYFVCFLVFFFGVSLDNAKEVNQAQQTVPSEKNQATSSDGDGR